MIFKYFNAIERFVCLCQLYLSVNRKKAAVALFLYEPTTVRSYRFPSFMIDFLTFFQ